MLAATEHHTVMNLTDSGGRQDDNSYWQLAVRPVSGAWRFSGGTMPRCIAVIAVVAILGISTAVADNLIVNGSFETGDVSGWSTDPHPFPSDFGFVTASRASDGTYSMFFDSGLWMWQQFTVPAGELYSVTFSVWATGEANNFGVNIWTGPLWDGPLPLTDGWVTYHFDGITARGEGLDIVAIGATGGIYLDNIIVESAVPEPGTLTLFAAGLLGVVGAVRRKLLS
jgi:hypothetical protein